MSDSPKDWWPYDYVEESAPEPRATPSAWIVQDDQGYALAARDGSPRKQPARRLAQGDIIGFLSREDFPDFDITVMPDGSYEPLTRIPAGADTFWKDEDSFDSEAQYCSLDDLANEISSDLSEAEEITVQCCAWSEEIAHRFTVTDGVASFVAVASDAADDTDDTPAASPPQPAAHGDPMRVTVDSNALAAALLRIAPIVEKRNTIPILGHVLFEVSGAQLRLTATDLDTDCVQTIPAVVERAGSCTANLRALTGILAQIPEATRVDIAAADGIVHFDIPRAGIVAAFESLPAVDFPRVTLRTERCRFALAAPKLAEALRLCEHAISREETRFYLNGVCLCLHESHLTAVATDGHRLVAVTLDGDIGSDLPADVIVPRRAVRALLAALPESGMAELMFGRAAEEKSGGSLTVSWPGGSLVSRLIDGSFPDWTRVLPEALPQAAIVARSRIDCDHAALARAVAAVRAMDSHRAITFECDNDGAAQPQLCLIGRDHGEGELRARIAATVKGAPPRIGFNALYWQQLLAVASGPVAIAFLDAQSPISIRFADLPHTRFVLMPLRV